MIDRISKLIALAENASTEAEAAAAFEMAQRLATRHAVSIEEARLHAAPKERETPIMRVVRIGERGKHSNARLINLFTTIGRANDVHCLIAHNSTFIEATGHPSDLDATEALWIALASDMSRWGDKLVRDKNAPWRSEEMYDWNTGEPKPVTAQNARKSFCAGYVSRIGERLQEARNASIKEADDERQEAAAELDGTSLPLPSSMALAMRNKSADVEAHQWAEYSRRYGKRRAGSWRGGRSAYGGQSSSASAAGRTAANNASMSGRRAVSA